MTPHYPKLACCNFMSEAKDLKDLAETHRLDGVDWSFTLEQLPRTLSEEVALLKTISALRPLEVRYHCAFPEIDLGDVDERKASEAGVLFRDVCRLVSMLEGRFLTIHIGLGHYLSLWHCP